MKKFNEMYVIGIDHGYGNMKTANCCFPTGVIKSDTEPTFVSDRSRSQGIHGGQVYRRGLLCSHPCRHCT